MEELKIYSEEERAVITALWGLIVNAGLHKSMFADISVTGCHNAETKYEFLTDLMVKGIAREEHLRAYMVVAREIGNIVQANNIQLEKKK